ncbi:MAG: uncharacterized protein JWN62_1997 [Acidimicrobiales bacterium]|nr:uncharacterized protein [Acidimicrobiales bacterium]
MTIDSGTEWTPDLTAPAAMPATPIGSTQPDAKDTAKQVAGAAAQETRNVTQSAADATKEVAHRATDQASAVADQAKQQLSSVVGQARSELRTQVDQRGQQAADGLQTLAGQLAALSEGRPQEAGHVGALVGDAQQRVQAYAQTLQQRGPQGLVDDISGFARRRPGTFLVAAAAAGFAAGRVARASSASSSDEVGR